MNSNEHSEDSEDITLPPISEGQNATEAVRVSNEHEEALAQHYERWFGRKEQFLYHEKVSSAVHVDTFIYPATDDRPFITAATIGMSALAFAPEGCAGEHPMRAELIIYLDRDWDFESNIGFAPIGLMQYVARYPHLEHRHFGTGYSYEAPSRPIVEGSLLTDLFVMDPVLENLAGDLEDFIHIDLPDGAPCHLQWLIPITLAECYVKQSEGSGVLRDILVSNDYLTLDVDRACFVSQENRAQRRAREKAQRIRAKRPPLKSVQDIKCVMCSSDEHHDV